MWHLSTNFFMMYLWNKKFRRWSNISIFSLMPSDLYDSNYPLLYTYKNISLHSLLGFLQFLSFTFKTLLYLSYILVHCMQYRFDFFKIISQLSPKNWFEMLPSYLYMDMYLKLVISWVFRNVHILWLSNFTCSYIS